MSPGDIVAIVPWKRFKYCPKCDHPNLSTGTYYPPSNGVPEHLSIMCSVCGYQYRMHTKT